MTMVWVEIAQRRLLPWVYVKGCFPGHQTVDWKCSYATVLSEYQKPISTPRSKAVFQVNQCAHINVCALRPLNNCYHALDMMDLRWRQAPKFLCKTASASE
ncbi:uncharacterized protein [Dysidea avara]|uniref:uncharacterized protein n=1 Tax=Dysidea avara TaxID=196820 RepID=UPI00332B8801